MVTGKEILAVASREIGYHRDKNGVSKYGEWYAALVDKPYFATAPYCMEFVQWVYHEAGADLPYKTPSCGSLLNWYRKNQPDCISKDPIEGCIVIFDFPNTEYKTDHTGLFVSKTDLKITTIDGNTSNGNDSNGGWVQQRTRSLSYANPTYIIPRELTEEAQMEQRYNTISEISDACPWAVGTVEKLIDKGYLTGDGTGLDLTRDMLRLLVINDRTGVYDHV